MWRWFWAGLIFATFIPIVGGGLIFRQWQKSDVIAFGVSVQGVKIGGMRSEQAKRKLDEAFNFATLRYATANVIWKGRIVRKVKLAELGMKPDFEKSVTEAMKIGRRNSLTASLAEFLRVWKRGTELPIAYKLDERNARQVLSQIAKSLNRPAQRALIELVGEKVRVLPSSKGLTVKIDDTLNLWRDRLAAGHWGNLPLAIFETEPEVSAEDLAEIDGIVGKASTKFKVSDRSRAHNIRLAAFRLDHLFIRPKENISFNEIVGPRTPKQGFKMARVLVRGQFTKDFGGGVCQVAGTLYLAALRAGMDVVQRHRHSRAIEYLPPGLDATVNFGSLDLKIRNPFDTPLYLRTFVKGGRLTILILGKREIGVEYRIVRAVEKFGGTEIHQIPEPNLALGMLKVLDKGSSGYRVTVWRLKVERGVVTERERISSDIYPPQPKLVLVGSQRKVQNEPLSQISPEAEEPNGQNQVQKQNHDGSQTLP
ncbi:MAG: VanW family protein [Armatimonadetes bacterium]|nr:VanW family protein [Armatimonadota bacterium]MDW8026798.1 VanW family protein [Armatimonadota bacterium]